MVPTPYKSRIIPCLAPQYGGLAADCRMVQVDQNDFSAFIEVADTTIAAMLISTDTVNADPVGTAEVLIPMPSIPAFIGGRPTYLHRLFVTGAKETGATTTVKVTATALKRSVKGTGGVVALETIDTDATDRFTGAQGATLATYTAIDYSGSQTRVQIGPDSGAPCLVYLSLLLDIGATGNYKFNFAVGAATYAEVFAG